MGSAGRKGNMVGQGDIIKINFNPQSGHEQSGYRPALVVSNNFFNKNINLVIVCPITKTKRDYPLHVELDSRTKTAGVIMCEQIKALDINSREYSFVESVPQDILEDVVNKIFSQIETGD